MVRVLAAAALVAAACSQSPERAPQPKAADVQAKKPTILAKAAVVTPPDRPLGPKCQAAFDCCRGAVERTNGRVPLDCPKLVQYGEPGCEGFLLQFRDQPPKVKQHLPPACLTEGVQP